MQEYFDGYGSKFDDKMYHKIVDCMDKFDDT